MKKYLPFVPFVVWLLFLLLLSSLPGSLLPNNLTKQFDKLIHFIEYFVLSFLWIAAVFKYSGSLSTRNRILSILFLIIVAVLDEIHQLIIPDRYFSIMDIVMDCIAVLSVILITVFINNDKLFKFWKKM